MNSVEPALSEYYSREDDPARVVDMLRASEHPVSGERGRCDRGWAARLAALDQARVELADRIDSPSWRRHAGALARGVLAQRRRWRQSDRIAAALSLARDVEHVATRDADGRSRHATTIAMVRGVEVAIPGRPVVQALSVAKLAGQIGRCRRCWNVVTTAKGLSETSISCGSMLCLDCADRRAREVRERYEPAYAALAAGGCPIVFGTHTIANDRGRSCDIGKVALTDEDLARWPDLAQWHDRARPGDHATPTGGDSFLSVVERFDKLWRSFQDNRANRAWFASTVVAARVGFEATSRAHNVARGAYGRLGWHYHAHVIYALQPGISAQAWSEALAARWVAHVESEGARASEAGQCVRVIYDGASDVDIDALTRAIGQVMKYPGKVDDMTTAAVIEFGAVVRGRTMQRSMRGLHSATRAGALARALAVAAVEADGGLAIDANDQPLSLAAALAPVSRYLGDEATIDQIRVALVADAGDRAAAALVAAWRALVESPSGDDESDEGDDDAAATGLVVAAIFGRPWHVQRVTRRQLWRWRAEGLTIRLGSVSFVSHPAAREMAMGGRQWVIRDDAVAWEHGYFRPRDVIAAVQAGDGLDTIPRMTYDEARSRSG